MDAPSLPDDPRDWPTDPFSLLGVPRSVSEADLKRAYTRLIRKYKPEHSPEEFRRIREAYETAIEMSRWFRDAPPVQDTFRDLPFTPVSPPPENSDSPDRRTSQKEPADNPHETQIDPPVRPVWIDPIEAAWVDAISGHWTEAYQALVSLAETHTERSDLPLRLYWLLGIRPTLDDARTRHDWLAVALTRARLNGPAVELYRRELVADPQVALYGPYVNLLERSEASGQSLLAVANARLVAAGKDRRWAILEIDLAALAHRSSELDEVEWLRYLADLAGKAASERPPVYEQCRQFLTGLKHLELSHSWVFDRLEHRQVFLTNLRLARLPELIRQALATAEVGGDSRQVLAAASKWAVTDPISALRAFDVGFATREAQPFLAAFAELLSQHSEDPEEYPQELLVQLVRSCLTRLPIQDYERARAPLLQFLLAERIDPEEFASVCKEDPYPNCRVLGQHLRDDAAIRLVYRTASLMI